MEAVDGALASDPLYATLIRTEVIYEEATQLRKSFRDAKSPLSVVRQEAYREIASRVEQSLAVGPPRATAVLGALEAHVDDVVATTRAALCSPLPPPPAADWAVPASAVNDAEVCALLLVLQVACVFRPAVQKRAADEGILQLLLQRLVTASPALACACFDAMMAIQLQQPMAFVSFVNQDGIQQVCTVLRHSSDRVRAHAARFLNLFLTQLAPSQVDTAVSSASGAGGISGGEPSSPVADSEDELTQVREAATSAKHAVEDALGREAGAMLMRHVELSDIQAESRLSQLASALQFFIG